MGTIKDSARDMPAPASKPFIGQSNRPAAPLRPHLRPSTVNFLKFPKQFTFEVSGTATRATAAYPECVHFDTKKIPHDP
jgi:hypothetical protein